MRAQCAIFIRNDPARPTRQIELVDIMQRKGKKRCDDTEQKRSAGYAVPQRLRRKRHAAHSSAGVTTCRKTPMVLRSNSYLGNKTLPYTAFMCAGLEIGYPGKYEPLGGRMTCFRSGRAIVTPTVIKGTAGDL